jgi:hypothetical protein
LVERPKQNVVGTKYGVVTRNKAQHVEKRLVSSRRFGF